MQVNIIRKPAPIDKIQIELSSEEYNMLLIILSCYDKENENNNNINYYSSSCQRVFVKKFLDELLLSWKIE